MTEKRPSLTFDYRGYEKQHRPDILALPIDQGNCLIMKNFAKISPYFRTSISRKTLDFDE